MIATSLLLAALYALWKVYWFCRRQDVERLHVEIETGCVKIRLEWR